MCGRDTHSRVEQATADAVKGPDIDQQRDSVGETNDQHRLGTLAASAGCVGGPGEGHEVAGIGEKQEHEGADKLCNGGNDMGHHGAQRHASPMGREDAMLLAG